MFIFSFCCLFHSTIWVPQHFFLFQWKKSKASADYVWLRSLSPGRDCRQYVYIILYSDNWRLRQTAWMKSNKYLNPTSPLHISSRHHLPHQVYALYFQIWLVCAARWRGYDRLRYMWTTGTQAAVLPYCPHQQQSFFFCRERSSSNACVWRTSTWVNNTMCHNLYVCFAYSIGWARHEYKKKLVESIHFKHHSVSIIITVTNHRKVGLSQHGRLLQSQISSLNRS